MRTLFLGVAISAGLIATYAKAEGRIYQIDGFDRVDVSEGVTTNISIGDRFLVSAEAIRGNIDLLKLELVDDTLEISRENTWSLFNGWRDPKFVVTIVMPDVDGVRASSGAMISLEGNSRENFEAVSSSGSTIVIEGDTLGDVELQASSGSTLRISGTCSDIDARSSSGSSLDASALVCETAMADSSSGSSLFLHATETAALEASSGSSLILSGGATITQQGSSSGASIRVR